MLETRMFSTEAPVPVRGQAIEYLLLASSAKASESPEAFLNEYGVTAALAVIIDGLGEPNNPYLPYKKISTHDLSAGQVFEAAVYPDVNLQPSLLHMWTYDYNVKAPVYGVSLPVMPDKGLDTARPITASWGSHNIVYHPGRQEDTRGRADLIARLVQQSMLRLVSNLQGDAAEALPPALIEQVYCYPPQERLAA